MPDKLEVQLKITLNRPALEQQLGKPVESDMAFYLLGLVGSLLFDRFGEGNCTIDLESATGLDDAFVRSMSAFARRHRQAVAELNAKGEIILHEAEMVEVLEALYDVTVVPVGDAWVVSQRRSELPQ